MEEEKEKFDEVKQANAQKKHSTEKKAKVFRPGWKRKINGDIGDEDNEWSVNKAERPFLWETDEARELLTQH